MPTLFVYGTLKRGLRNHFRLGAARFIGEAATEPGYRLVDLGSYPGMLPDSDGVVVGELYEVDAATLARLDEFEGVPTLFERREVRIAGRSDRVETYFFVGDASRGVRVEGGEYGR